MTSATFWRERAPHPARGLHGPPATPSGQEEGAWGTAAPLPCSLGPAGGRGPRPQRPEKGPQAGTGREGVGFEGFEWPGGRDGGREEEGQREGREGGARRKGRRKEGGGAGRGVPGQGPPAHSRDPAAAPPTPRPVSVGSLSETRARLHGASCRLLLPAPRRPSPGGPRAQSHAAHPRP